MKALAEIYRIHSFALFSNHNSIPWGARIKDNLHRPQKAQVLELGAGVGGLPGIVAAQRGSAKTVFTDFEDVLPWLEPNVRGY